MKRLDRKLAEKIIDNGYTFDIRYAYRKGEYKEGKLITIHYIEYEEQEYIIAELDWEIKDPKHRELNHILYDQLTLKDVVTRFEVIPRADQGDIVFIQPLQKALDILKEAQDID